MNSNTFLSFVFLAVISMSVTAHANAVPAPAPSGVGGVVGNIGKNIGKIIRKGGGIGTAIQVGVAVVDIITSDEMTEAKKKEVDLSCGGVWSYGGYPKTSSPHEMVNQILNNIGRDNSEVSFIDRKGTSLKFSITNTIYGRTVNDSMTCFPSAAPDVVGGAGADTGSRPISAPDVVGGSEVGVGAGAVPDVGKGTDVGTGVGVGVGADTRPIPDSKADSIPDSKAGAVPDVGAGVGVGTGVGVGAGTQAGTQAGAKADSKADTDTALPPETAPISRDEEWELEFPVFCDWAKPVCDFLDWFKKEPEIPDDKLDVEKPTLSDLGIDDSRFDKRFHFDKQCPAGEKLQFSVNGISFNKEIPYDHFCQFLEKLKPWLLSFTCFSTAMFVLGNL